ncbi:MAG: hypothetical protein HYX78_09430 [Armatimonadetes bacterium]|nr:hypothetical protein [Armatimonadota bacterium]
MNTGENDPPAPGALPSTDLDGDDRLLYDTVDMGADELYDPYSPTITITAPVGDIHKHPDALVPVEGTATDAFSGIATVKVWLDGTPDWPNAPVADYNSTTKEWTYAGWDMAAGSHTIYARAYDRAGNYADTNVTVEVSDITGPGGAAGIIYVKPSGSDSNSGLSWANAKATVQNALNTAYNGGNIYPEVWVAAADVCWYKFCTTQEWSSAIRRLRRHRNISGVKRLGG